jgi:integrase
LKTDARQNRYAESEATEGLSLDTVRKRISNAKQFFGEAVAHELIPKNPFAKLKSATKGNRKRDFFVTQEMAKQVIDACPDAQWRLLFALSRYGGLRCPSEHLALRLDDVDWERDRLRVTSPKTEHHEGGILVSSRYSPSCDPSLTFRRASQDQWALLGSNYRERRGKNRRSWWSAPFLWPPTASMALPT